MKTCSKCRTGKRKNAFYRCAGVFQSWCKECVSGHARTRRETDPEGERRRARDRYKKNLSKSRKNGRDKSKRWRDAHPEHVLKRRAAKVGVSSAQFESQLKRQGFGCEICGRPFITRSHACLDHNHHTGKFRSLLCSKCNVGLGMFDDSPRLLRLAALYLKVKP